MLGSLAMARRSVKVKGGSLAGRYGGLFLARGASSLCPPPPLLPGGPVYKGLAMPVDEAVVREIVSCVNYSTTSNSHEAGRCPTDAMVDACARA